MSGRIDVERADGALVVRIANPDRANALDDVMLASLAEALSGPAAADARVVLLTGAGPKAFSAGVAIEPGTAEEQIVLVRRREALLGEAVAAIDACPRPVVGVLNGSTIGGALELAVACDWRIAAERAWFAMPPARLGVVYSARGLRRFAATIGVARTSELFMTGRRVTSAEALAWGLVSEVVPADDLWDRATAVAEEISALAPAAVAGTRAILRAIARADDVEAVDSLAGRVRAEAYASEDLIEGLAAFAERREPRFTGR